jgi:acetylornithine deacetylase/succinyl-diaminopimelate desuccinylase-like protein
MSSFPATLADLLCELIARPSVAPEGDSGGTPPGEQAMADYVATLLRAMGGEVSVTPVEPGRPNVVARFPTPDRKAPVVALVPHLDTVGVDRMTIAPFSPTLLHGRIYGRGACDTKGPMAAALWALRRHLDCRETASARITWTFAATMGEEELSTGATALCRQGFRAGFAIALEPTDLRLVHAEKGVLRLWVEATGRACHGSAPEQGENAIYKLLPFLEACEHQLAPALSRTRHPALGGASLNVGVLTGGRELNVVPDRCRAGLDLRTHPGLTNQDALALVRSAAAGLTVSVHRDGAPFALAADHPWVQALGTHAAGLATAPWFSDANVFNAHGIPSVAFGPGSIAQAHTADEFIELASLEAGARALEAFMAKVDSNPPC